ncbi:MAG: hypothetical protein RJB26_1386 [Pseudomonadota bacterium]
MTGSNMRRLAAAVAVLLAMVAAALWLSAPLQDSVLRRAVAKQLQPPLAPLSADRAFRVVFCGTGSPLPDRTAAKSCLAVFAAGKFFVVDTGPESTENLLAWRLPLAKLDGVLLTHFHSDHIGELGELNLQSWLQGRTAPLPVYGPPGVEKVVAGFNLAYAQDEDFRHAHHARDRGLLPLSGSTLSAHSLPFLETGKPESPASAVVYEQAGLRITAFAVDHGVVRPAYGYRFDYRGRSVVVSGDTRPSAGLAVAAAGADVLVHEAQSKELMSLIAGEAGRAGNPALSTLLADTNEYHTSPVEAAKLANTAVVRELVFTHFTPPISNPLARHAFFRGVKAVRRQHWRAARDGLWLEIPMDGSAIKSGVVKR